jgi:hypothetical protein
MKMPTMTARDHLDWATNRALNRYDAGDKKNAFAGFLSDVTKHADTAWIASHSSTLMLLELGWNGGRSEFKRMLEGFAASDQLPEQPHFNPAPVNTATEDGAMQTFFGTMAGGSFGDTIMAQESAGQSGLVNSNTLPSDMSAEGRQVLEQAGVVFGDPVPGDDMFVNVNLPEGWRKVATSHSMWSDLVDDKGRKRASMFYKAAFYDRSAHLNTNRRFAIGMDYDRSDKGVIVKFVTDGDTKAFATKEYPYTGEKYREHYKTQDSAATDEVKAWLEEHYPNWEDASAYWD